MASKHQAGVLERVADAGSVQLEVSDNQDSYLPPDAKTIQSSLLPHARVLIVVVETPHKVLRMCNGLPADHQGSDCESDIQGR